MRALFFALVVPAAFMLSACSADRDTPTRADLEAIRQAQNVFPAGFKSDVMAFLRNYLNDPTGIRSAAISQPALKNLPTGARYVACLRYDAKKSSGGYAGVKTALVVFISGRLDRFIAPTPRDPSSSADSSETVEIREACKDAGYVPFPELGRLTR